MCSLLWEGRSAHRSSRSAALRSTRARWCANSRGARARRRRRGAEGRQSGTLSHTRTVTRTAPIPLPKTANKGETHPNLRNPPDPLSHWAFWSPIFGAHVSASRPTAAMKLSLLGLLLPLSVVAAWWPAKKTPPAPPPVSEGGMDMSATFAKLRTCEACVAAGYGWCPNRRKCGGFATEGCGEGERYVAEGEPYAAPSSTSGGGGGGGSGGGRRGGKAGGSEGGTDMRATFARYSTCAACVGAGYGWCTIQRKCGGFANRECGEGERYVSEGLPASRGRPSRNAAWPKCPLWASRGFGCRPSSKVPAPAPGGSALAGGQLGPLGAQPLPQLPSSHARGSPISPLKLCACRQRPLGA